MSSPEQEPRNPEASAELPKVTAEHYEALKNGGELGVEDIKNKEHETEKARAEVDTAIKVESGSAEKAAKKPREGHAPRRRGAISKKEKTTAYKKHVKQFQAELPPVPRAFSKVIHNPAIEKTSEVVGATIARPNAILSGAIVAFVLVLAVYLIAKNLGYVLSGFETIGAFIVGWVLGVLYDYLRVLVTGKKS